MPVFIEKFKARKKSDNKDVEGFLTKLEDDNEVPVYFIHEDTTLHQSNCRAFVHEVRTETIKMELADKTEADRKAAAAPDKEKLLAFREFLSEIILPKCTTEEGCVAAKQIGVSIESIRFYIIESIRNF
jgi:hypothetical protein